MFLLVPESVSLFFPFFLTSQEIDKMLCHDPRNFVVILFFYKNEIIFSANMLCSMIILKMLLSRNN